MDFRDAFFGGLWVVLILVPAGVAGKVFLDLGIGWAAGLAVLVDGVGGGTAGGIEQLHTRSRSARAGVAADVTGTGA